MKIINNTNFSDNFVENYVEDIEYKLKGKTKYDGFTYKEKAMINNKEKYIVLKYGLRRVEVSFEDIK